MRMPWMAVLALLLAAPAAAAEPAFDARPWLQDWAQVEHAMATSYSDLEWAVFDREADLPRMFADTRSRIAAARNDAGARAAFDRFARRLGDGHVAFDWPAPAAPPSASSGPAKTPDRCAGLGYDSRMLGRELAAHAQGYRPLPDAGASAFPAGMLAVDGVPVGVLKIGLFSPHGTPALCEAALKALAVPPEQPCDDACADRVDAWTSARLTEDLARRIRALQAAGARALVIDVAGNGGGSQWAEAAARMLTPIRLRSERGGFVRGEHWVKTFTDDEAELRQAAAAETGVDRDLLLGLTDRIAVMRKEAATPCSSAPFFEGRRPVCSWLGEGYSGTGPLDQADPARLRGKPWAATVFSPMEFPYEEGVWRGPLVVLIDQDAGSATAMFAAELQDNHAAAIIGAPSSGGCGHTNGGTPVRLANSGGVLEIPDCARFRADGGNEVRGIQPDVLVGFTPTEGPRLQAGRFLARLPEALAMAARR